METQLTLPPEPGGLPRARALAGATSAAPPLLDAIKVVIAELASNAVHHARTSYTVTVREDPVGAVTVAVVDHSTELPVVLSVPPTQVGGRGMKIVEQLAASWGTDPVPGNGKTVWAVLRDEPPPHA